MLKYAKTLKNLTTFIALALLLMVLLSACATPKVVYKEVKIPIKCDVKERKKPKNNGNIVSYLKEVLIYSEGLERDLSYCRGN